MLLQNEGNSGLPAGVDTHHNGVGSKGILLFLRSEIIILRELRPHNVDFVLTQSMV